jgi:endoglucanase
MRMILPRLFFIAATLLLLGLRPGFGQPAVPQPDPVEAEWAKYRDRFVTEDGRVLDTGNKAVSHTEGQGWALLFAETAGDRASFAKVWRWTRDNLQRRDNALFSWRFDPADDKTPVADANDASDGDILIAWALIRAADRWHDPEYREATQRIVADIRRRLLISAPGRLMLLPGAAGFKGKDGVTVVNPSYYVYPALKDFARLQPSPQWQKLRRDGLGLLAEARFGRWGLTPDWIDVDHNGTVQPAAKFPARFGFDAIRIPLYLIWAGDATPERLASYLDFWNDFGKKPIPAWADVKDNSVAPYAGSTGFQAVIELVRAFGQTEAPALPMIGDKDDYYAASLTLLAAIAQRETAR